jgi:2-keto-4-pentenoate hydratase/2-oxohepta-3-ene-1,7-dioic acid hydratase in catechol pathway
MIWCRYEHAGGVSYGFVEGETVFAVEGSPFAEHRVTSRSHPLAEVKLLVPVIPGTFYAAGANYAGHIAGMVARGLVKPDFWPAKPDIGYRANNALLAHGENIVKPRDAGDELQYEAELVAVIGRRARNVSREEAMGCIFGWTIGNDVTERSWVRSDRVSWRAKNCDTFKPMGPWIVTGLDPADMTTVVRLNGEVVEHFPTGRMIFDAATYIESMSRYMTLHPGDVIWLGTDGHPKNMAPGDVLEIEISGIGTLRNAIASET